MSIATKTGDEGETSLMYGRRVPKTDQRVEAYGCVDELNSALGLARASTKDSFLTEQVLAVTVRPAPHLHAFRQRRSYTHTRRPRLEAAAAILSSEHQYLNAVSRVPSAAAGSGPSGTSWTSKVQPQLTA